MVHVQCIDKSPLVGVQVWIDLFFVGIDVPVYRTYGITNMDGDFYVTSNDDDWYVYNGLWHTEGHPWQATGWTSYLVGYWLGVRFGRMIARRLKPELIGGLVLIFIGVKVLLSHLLDL